MRVVALLAIRNEALFLERCLNHLYHQGIETCIIDNDSTDSSLAIAQSYIGRGVSRIVNLPYEGCFDLPRILKLKEMLTREIDADWFIHYDADEIREAPKPYNTLLEGIEEADKQGFNAINFDEFVFMPTSNTEAYENKDYVAQMQYYYFFEPYPLRRLNAWKKMPEPVDIVNSAGHCVSFPGLNLFPTSFIMRHYICLSREHAIAKYGTRVFSLNAVKERGWSKDRVNFTADNLYFPEKSRLKQVTISGDWDKSDPWVRHKSLFGDKITASKQISNQTVYETQACRSRSSGNWARRLLSSWFK
ncbi:MAG: glycosyltransferase family 2 protein [Methylotenera sp.]|uniref:glycosyltransferase family 2 protein n=1 Tax=Methylotenera sp. TaxID=2051956 RepID=UPI00272199F2|nr:glycosyltransferase family 2 protein [Methylotenera sp.]MDO9150181.1 glycosyltransferase family 2 protein [Methylotenera sp.]